MSVRAAVGCQSGIHQTQTVQKLRSGSKGTADPGNSGALMQCQRCRNIEDFIHLRFRRTGHTSSRICGQGFQITSGALCIEDTQRQRRFPRTGYPGDPNNFVQGNIHIYIFQVMNLCTSYLDMLWFIGFVFHDSIPHLLISLKQIQHIVQIDFFSDLQLVLRLRHIIQ